MCQVVSLPPLAFVSTLQTAGKNTFFFPERSLLGSSETNFWTVAVPIDSNSLMFQKKKNPGFYFPLNFWHVLSYHIISYRDASKTKRREGPARTVHIDREPSQNTHPSVHCFRPFVLPWMPVFRSKTHPGFFEDAAASPAGLPLLSEKSRNGFKELGDRSHFPPVVTGI